MCKFLGFDREENFTLRPRFVFVGGEVLSKTLYNIQQRDLTPGYLFTILACIVDESGDRMCSPATISAI